MSRSYESDRRDIESEVLVVIYEHVGERVQVRDLANELNMDENELRSIILRLSTKTTAKLSFDRDTGELLISQPMISGKTGATQSLCTRCNHPLPNGALYCPYCGNAVSQ
jgi:hypothetical protein